MSDPRQRTCPICNEVVNKDLRSFPFCSERCKEIDLGQWALEKYRIPAAEPSNEDSTEE